MTKSTQKKITVSVTNDLVSDNRVHKVCTSLKKMGFDVLLIGIKKKNSPPLKREYKTCRMKLLFKKGACFYAEYNIRLFGFLLFKKVNVFVANDLDSLLANHMASKIKKRPLVYDSHEYFTELPELINRPGVKRVWEKIEKKTVPGIKHAYTVCESIAKAYSEKYGINFKVVRNIPIAREYKPVKNTRETKIILYQGAVNIGRGLMQAIKAMHYVKNAQLVIAGNGDIKTQLEKLVIKENLQGKVEFTGRLPIDELTKLTPRADLGLSIEEDLGLNYRFALPNKLFDYIQAQVPVLISNLPEMKAIVEKYKIGDIAYSHSPEKLAQSISEALINDDKRKTWKDNLRIASKELIWENEEKILFDIYSKLL